MKRTLFWLISSIIVGVMTAPDSAAQWVQTNLHYSGNINALAVSGDNVFAGTDSGVFLSTDNGESWEVADTGLTNLSVLSLVVSPNKTGGATVFVGTHGGGVFVSTNDGKVWQLADSGLTNLNVWSLAVGTDDSGGSFVYAGNGNGVFLTANGGISWQATGLTNAWIMSIALYPSQMDKAG